MKISDNGKWLYKIILLIGYGLTTGCGPVYDTKYSFIPPNSSEGKTCIYQCDNAKLQCEQMEDMKQETCQLRSQLECRDDKNCPQPVCTKEYERCERNYRSCYQVCGGTINSQEVCVFGCK